MIAALEEQTAGSIRQPGSNRRENITDWALREFRTHYSDPNITKWDIFHYVYAVLHHPEYRERYAANLKRELPRIPFVGGTADPSTRTEVLAQDDNSKEDAGSARDDNSKENAGSDNPLGEGAGLVSGPPSRAAFVRDGVNQASRKDALNASSTLPRASAQPKAERHKETADPSTRAEALAQDDNGKGNAGRGAEAPLYPHGNRGPSTPLRSAQDDSSKDGTVSAQDDTRCSGLSPRPDADSPTFTSTTNSSPNTRWSASKKGS